MARQTTRLSDTEIKKAKPKDKEYSLADGQGLQLRIRPNGSKSWLYNYTSPTRQKRTNLGFGQYPEVSLKLARELASEARELVAVGTDPKEHREQQKAAQLAEQQNTFLSVAEKWFEIKRHEVSKDYADDIWRSLVLHAFPSLANYPIRDVKAPLVIETLKPLEAKGSLETVKRISQRLNEIMNYAANCGLIDANPLTGIKAAFKKPHKESMATIKPEQLPDLLRAIANASIKKTTRCLVHFQLHTMTRPSEAAGAMWSEIDFENKVWIIPAERMKKKKEHRIPLTDQVIAILSDMQRISGNREHIFPSDRDPKKSCSSQTVNMALRRMGFKGQLVSHGFRALASTTLNEQGKPHHVIEAALAHSEKNQTVAAYNRATYFDDRKVLMQHWSTHIQSCSTYSYLTTC